MPSAEVLHRHATFGFPKEPDDLHPTTTQFRGTSGRGEGHAVSGHPAY